MRRLWALGEKVVSLAERYGVSGSYVRRIVTNERRMLQEATDLERLRVPPDPRLLTSERIHDLETELAAAQMEVRRIERRLNDARLQHLQTECWSTPTVFVDCDART
jgi:sensor histidine kinase YesM